jgi:predicted ATP-grasp superfamily ATP-dependent carboligase
VGSDRVTAVTRPTGAAAPAIRRVCHTAGMDVVRVERRPKLDRPAVVVAFRGWNDAGGAASLAAGYLKAVTDADRFAVIDGEEFIDFQQTRPTVSLVDGEVRQVEWPDTEVFAARDGDLVLVIGTEPNLRWRGFAAALAGLAGDLDARLVVTLGALLADTPHTRPVPISATASDPELMAEHGLTRSTYEGPTGIIGVLHDACARHGLRSASLWAATPHYISAAPNPRAAYALLDRLASLVGTPPPSDELRRAASEYALRVAAAIADDEEITEYVSRLEEQADAEAAPSGDELAADFERYLRDRTTDDPEP